MKKPLNKNSLNPSLRKRETGKGKTIASPFRKGRRERVFRTQKVFMHPYNPKLKQVSQELRKNMTDAEKVLWSKLRMKQLKGLMFSRQKPIGGYIVDFYCHKAKLVIEVDGGQHFSNDSIEYDRIRDELIGGMGLTVLRFTNIDVLKNIIGVIEVIERNLP